MRPKELRTCLKSSVVRGPGPVVRRCSPQSLPDPAPRRPPTRTSYSAPINVHPTPTSLQFRVLYDLHRPATRRRRHVELPNPTVHIPSRDTSVPCPQHPTHTEPTQITPEQTQEKTPIIRDPLLCDFLPFKSFYGPSYKVIQTNMQFNMSQIQRSLGSRLLRTNVSNYW